MAHVEKYTKVALGHMFRHYERSARNYSNENIDKDRTYLNYNLAPNRDISQLEFIKKRISEVKCLKRDDVNVMCDWVLTAPKDLDPSKEEEFFKESYNFLEKRYGKENVISSYVHLDEVRPHMHFSFLPVTYDSKKNIEKVSAKTVVSRTDLRNFHKQLQEHLDAKGIKCSILNEATKEGNKSIEELKRGTAIETLNKIKANIEALEGDLKALQGIKGQVDHLDTIDVKKLPMGARIVKEEDLKLLMDLAKKGIANEDKIERLEKDNKSLEGAREKFYNENYDLRQENYSFRRTINNYRELHSVYTKVLENNNLMPQVKELQAPVKNISKNFEIGD